MTTVLGIAAATDFAVPHAEEAFRWVVSACTHHVFLSNVSGTFSRVGRRLPDLPTSRLLFSSPMPFWLA